MTSTNVFMLNPKHWRVTKLQMIVTEGAIIPSWMGVAYCEWHRATYVCYPIPINLVVRWLRDLYYWLKATRHQGWLDTKIANGYLLGHEAGRKAGERMNEDELRRLRDLERRIDEYLR